MKAGSPGPPRSVEIAPNSATAELDQAEDLLRRRRVVEAIAHFDTAEQIGADPDACCAGRWQCFMLLGDFSRAWLESDSVGRTKPEFLWDGSSLHGRRIIVRCLHGLGDAIQFLRYAPLMREQCSSLVVEVPPAMLELAPFFDGVEQIITWGKRAPSVPPEWDAQVEVMELPYLFRSTVSSLPASKSYLRLPDAIVREPQPSMRNKPGLRVGIVWSAGEWDLSRSIPCEMLEPLLSIGRGVSFLSLQRVEDNIAWFEKAREIGLETHALPRNGLLAVALAIANLDLVITVDTMAAHLAAAMGVPTWVLLQHAADWRWMLERSDSPWYPSMRLFRQRIQGDWTEVLEDVRGRLLSCSGSFAHLGENLAALG